MANLISFPPLPAYPAQDPKVQSALLAITTYYNQRLQEITSLLNSSAIGGGDDGLLVTPQLFAMDYTVPSASNAIMIGPTTIEIGYTLSVPLGSNLTVK